MIKDWARMANTKSKNTFIPIVNPKYLPVTEETRDDEAAGSMPVLRNANIMKHTTHNGYYALSNKIQISSS